MIRLIRFCLMCVTFSDSAKILEVFIIPSVSHQVVFRHYTNELIRRGHEVTVITTDPEYPKGEAPANLTEIDLHDLSYGAWQKVVQRHVKGKTDTVSQMNSFFTASISIFEEQLRTVEIQKLINETKHFDLIVVDGCLKTPLIFSHFYKAPLILMTSFAGLFYNYEMMGIPTHPFLYPTTLIQRVSNLTMWEKVKEAYKFWRYKWSVDGFQLELENGMLKRVFGPDTPSVADLSNNIDLWLMNAHPLWMTNVPLPPNVISIWGIHKRFQKELPEDLKALLDSSKNGVIYMSFGTNTYPSSLPAEKIQAFIKVFSQLPYDVIWKWDKDELPGRTDNIKIGKWFPQSDLLRHPKIKLFITQGGLQSTEEAILAGVPLVGVPMLADQWYNVEMYEHFKIGKKLDIEILTADDVRSAIDAVISDKSFRESIKKIRTLMRDQPDEPLERAMWWTEYLLRHGGAKHLRSPAANITWAQYYEVQLVGTVLFILVFVISALLFFFRFVVKFVLVPRSKVKQN